jgi:uncharacterized protein YndB with AHSA1/START domain
VFVELEHIFVYTLVTYWLHIKGSRVEKLAIELNIWVAAPRERVWRAITEPQELSAWLYPETTWEMPTLQVGAPVLWRSSETEVDLHIIEAIDAPHQFALRWMPCPPDLGRTTTFLLEEDQNGTFITILESGFELLPEEWQEQRMFGADEGYHEALENLKGYLERSVR